MKHIALNNNVIIFLLFALMIAITLSSCSTGNQREEGKVIPAIRQAADTLPKTSTFYKWTEQELKEFRDQEIQDSMHALRALKKALRIAETVKGKNHYNWRSDTLIISYGYLFSRQQKHLLIKRSFAGSVFTNLYKLDDNKFREVLSDDRSQLAYITDTIRDVNGDNLKDYLVHWYPASGCCERNVFEVFLLTTNRQDFTKSKRFINPTFSPKEKVVRGLCYGHEPTLYKFRWQRYTIDTVEYIYITGNPDNFNYVKKRRRDTPEAGIRLTELPEEYRKMGYGN